MLVLPRHWMVVRPKPQWLEALPILIRRAAAAALAHAAAAALTAACIAAGFTAHSLH